MLENIEIIDYKCFKNFKLDGLSQINIISGGNNVGKTALLEALCFENHIFPSGNLAFNDPTSAFYQIAQNRDILVQNKEISANKFTKFLKTAKILLKSNNININIQYKDKFSLSRQEEKEIQIFNQDYYGFLIAYIDDILKLFPVSEQRTIYFPNNYINSSKPTNKQIINLYSNIQTKGIQYNFLEYLRKLDNNITLLEPQLIDDELLLRVNLKNPEHSLISSELGEGTNRYIEILATLLSNSKGSVFIDEIENGIHYSKLKDIWKAIIEIVQKEEIQLFVTTHDKESIEALIEASEESKYEDISSIQLYKDENNNISPIVMQYKNFAYGINRGADVR